MYYRIKNNKIYDYSDTKYDESCLFSELCTKTEYQEHQSKYIIGDAEEEIDVLDYDENGCQITIEVEDENADIIQIPSKHKEVITVKKLILNPDYEQEQAEKERKRIANLHMTRGDVFRGLLLSKGVTRAEIREIIESMSEETPQERVDKEMALIDFDEALEFYRGVPLIDTLGTALEITSEQMDKFFETKNFTELISESVEEE